MRRHYAAMTAVALLMKVQRAASGFESVHHALCTGRVRLMGVGDWTHDTAPGHPHLKKRGAKLSIYPQRRQTVPSSGALTFRQPPSAGTFSPACVPATVVAQSAD